MLRTGQTVAQICDSAEITPEALELLTDETEPRAFVEEMTNHDLFADAIGFLAHALPAREAVGWAYVCAKDAVGENPEPATSAVLEATRKWIAEPTDEAGRAAREAAEEAGIGTPAGFTGLAAFFSGGNMAPPDAPPTPPEDSLPGKTVSGSINMSAAWNEAEKVTDNYRDYVERGLELADRIGLWDTET